MWIFSHKLIFLEKRCSWSNETLSSAPLWKTDKRRMLKGCLCFFCSGNMSVKANRQLACTAHPSRAATSTLHILITGELTASSEINALFKRRHADCWWKWMKIPFSLAPFSATSLRYLLAENVKTGSSASLINAVSDTRLVNYTWEEGLRQSV